MITLKEARKLAESFIGDDYIIVGSNEFKNGFGFYISTAFSKKMFVGATLVFVNKFTKKVSEEWIQNLLRREREGGLNV